VNTLLESILKDKKFINSKGEEVVIHSNTSYKQCVFLQSIIKENKLNKSIEIGFAFGTSTLAIAESIKENKGTKHVVIDKFENTVWGGHGLELLKKAELDNMADFKEEYCYKVLSEYIHNNEKFDFAYVDTTKQFDWILTDLFLLDKIIEPGGIIVFDDVAWPGIRKAMRFISRMPHYKVIGQHPKNYISVKRKLLKSLLNIIPFKTTLFRDDILNPDYELGINCSCVAFKKIGEDSRNWDWYKSF
jgi:predicted O-methyltransferase YrrM